MLETFLNGYLQISNWTTVFFIFFFLVAVVMIRKLDKMEYNYTKILVLAMMIGVVLGLLGNWMANEYPTITKEVSSWYGLVGYGFMDLLKMVAIPLVFISMIRVIITTKQDFKKLAIRTVIVLATTTVIASVVAILLSGILPLTESLTTATDTQNSIREVSTFVTTLRGMIPSNAVDIFAKGNILAVIVLAFLLGISLKSLESNESVQPLIRLVEATYQLIRKLAVFIMDLMPYAIIPLLANVVITQGNSTILGAINFVVVLYVAIIVMFVIHLVIVRLFKQPVKEYLKAVKKPLLLAFTSRSSLGTLPVTIDAMTTKLHIPSGIADIVGSFGANMGMNGCAGIYPTLVVITLATMLKIPMDISFFIMLVFVVVLGSFGIAGIPGAATMSVAIVLTGMGLVEYYPLLGVILAIDPILDMGRTMLNVNGTLVAGVVVNELEKKK
ncbi:cation:dicarboxylate symporter family transporter [Anaerorhabdus sp.]|uniref:cation:dicarboxylate symporter family transporter n=1 Tax=Anaerorhabdus sp. TaxID=1872524 RepID=UPI002FCB80AA